MPMVINRTHEAKPHLPGAVLTLLAVMAAMRYVETGKRSSWMTMAFFCGAAFGMVLTAWVTFAVAAELLRKSGWKHGLVRVLLGGTIGSAVYCLTNPYVLINLCVNRELLWSNLGNTQAMFEPNIRLGSLMNAVLLVNAGTSPAILGFAVFGLVAWIVHVVTHGRHPDKYESNEQACRGLNLAWLVAAPAILNFAQFVTCATGQAAEYGRFCSLTDIGLLVAAVVFVRRMVPETFWRWPIVAAPVVLTGWSGYTYLAGFVNDSRSETTRVAAARHLDTFRTEGGRSPPSRC